MSVKENAWMTNLKEDTRLNQLVFLGTHNSLGSNFIPDVDLEINPFSIQFLKQKSILKFYAHNYVSQKVDLIKQLLIGIRVFHFKCHFDELRDMVFIHNGFAFTTLLFAMDCIQNFVSHHPKEIIQINIDFTDKNPNITKIKKTLSIHQDYFVNTVKRNWTSTLKEIWTDQTPLMIVSNLDLPGLSVFKSSPLVESFELNQNVLSLKESLLKLPTKQNEQRHIKWLNPNVLTKTAFIKSFFNIFRSDFRKKTRQHNKNFEEFLNKNRYLLKSRVNVVFFDMFETTEFFESFNSLNKEFDYDIQLAFDHKIKEEQLKIVHLKENEFTFCDFESSIY